MAFMSSLFSLGLLLRDLVNTAYQRQTCITLLQTKSVRQPVHLEALIWGPVLKKRLKLGNIWENSIYRHVAHDGLKVRRSYYLSRTTDISKVCVQNKKSEKVELRMKKKITLVFVITSSQVFIGLVPDEHFSINRPKALGPSFELNFL